MSEKSSHPAEHVKKRSSANKTHQDNLDQLADRAAFASSVPQGAARFLNRELTWLAFNDRVLHEATDPRVPILERVKFLAISASNLDEFFMKRIGGLKQQVGAGVGESSVDGRTPQQQLAACYEVIRRFDAKQHAVLQQLRVALKEAGVHLANYDELSETHRTWLTDYYTRNVFPLMTPQARDPAHPFPFVSNLSLNLLVSLHLPKESNASMARVKIPVGQGIPRFVQVGDQPIFVPLEQIVKHNLHSLFPDMQVESCEPFRVTRNANTEHDEEEADDLLELIETELRERRFAPVVRLQVGAAMPAHSRGMLAAELGLNEAADVFPNQGLMGLRDLQELANLDIKDLHDAPHHPIDHPDLPSERSIFHAIRDVESILLQHPYESFATSVERFLREASLDPKVRAIKMTLYRTSADMRFLGHLVAAAQAGKQVAVVVELKARFDEQANIVWAGRLEEAGIHVSYGVIGLKTHCKVILVVRRDYDGLRLYSHVGTGNYHPGTARVYSDLGLLTCDSDIGADLTELFNYLTTGYKPSRHYKKIIPAPKHLKAVLLAKIEREARKHSPKKPGLIQMKMNALEDADIVSGLYQAAQRGVTIDLIVRDSCRLRPGIAGLSETVRVVSLLGQFLEHARVFYFRNGGDEEYFIGSADCMTRNLESRIETVVPIEDKRLRKELRFMLDTQLNDQRIAWDMLADGSYLQRQPKSLDEEVGAQRRLIERAEKRRAHALKLRYRRPKGPGQRA